MEDAHHGTTLEEPSLQCVRPIAQMDTSRTCADCRERERERESDSGDSKRESRGRELGPE